MFRFKGKIVTDHTTPTLCNKLERTQWKNEFW